MAKTNTLPKTGINPNDAIRSQLRDDNINHEAEIKMLIAICEAHGITVKRDKNTKELSLELPQSTATPLRSSPPPPPVSPSPASSSQFVLDTNKVIELLKPIIKNQIDDSISKKDITANAFVDASILVANNKEVFDVIVKEWREWMDTQKTEIQNLKNSSPNVMTYGNDTCYKVPEAELYKTVDSSTPSGTTEISDGRASQSKTIRNHIWEDIITSWWKAAAYVIALCCIIVTIATSYRNHQLEQVAKEYYIIKPVLRQDKRYGPFVHSLDSAIMSSGVDEVCEKLYGKPK